jgi:MGT family glycosyltransferase
MARVLAYTSPARGHLFPATPILDELARRGHEISLRTLGSQVEVMRQRGFDAAPIDPAIEATEHDDYKARTPLGALKRALATFAKRAPMEVGDVQRAVTDVNPDALLVDINCWGGGAAAEAADRPWATWCPFPLPLPSRDVPPYGPGLRPSAGPIGRLRDAAVGRLTFRPLERAVRDGVNAVRDPLGLAPLQSAAEWFAAPPLLIYLTAEPFEYHRSDWPGNVRMVGPCDWDPPARVPDWLAEVSEPIVLVTTSSEIQDDGRLVETALEALAGEDVQVVATVPARDPAGFDPPANARVLEFVPHGLVLDRATCAITHGGMGATQKALARGVPVCAVPFGRDQLEVARRVEVAGAGMRLPVNRLKADRLRERVHQAIDCRPGAQRVADGYEAAGGAKAAADAFEGLIGER